MIRCVSTSLFSVNNLSSNAPNSLEHDFFLCRYEYTSSSPLSWSAGIGFVDRESGRPIPTTSTKRRLSTHELFIHNPSMFSEPLWILDIKEINNNFILDVSINMKVLVDYISRGVVIPGRRVIILIIREFRQMKESSYDGICYFENFIYGNLWKHQKPISFYNITSDPEHYLHSTRDFRPVAQKRLQNSSVSLHIQCDTITTPLLRGQQNAVENMKYLERGMTYKVIQRKNILFGVNGMYVGIDGTEQLLPVAEIQWVDVIIRGGYLTDSMGSGKTLSMITLTESTRDKSVEFESQSRFNAKATVIICPSQVVFHWKKELGKHVNRDVVIITLCTKKDFELSYEEIRSADYIIISFGIFNNALIKDFSESYSPNCSISVRCQTYCNEIMRCSEQELDSRLEYFLFLFDWYRVIVDEFHELDTNHSSISQYVFCVRSHTRWMVSGSPFVNSISSVKSILQFLWMDGWNDYSLLMTIARDHFVKNTEDFEIDLPPIREMVIPIQITDIERNIYDSLQSQGRQQQLRACASLGLTSILRNNVRTVSSISDMRAIVMEHMSRELNSIKTKLSSVVSSLEYISNNHDSGRILQMRREGQAEKIRLENRIMDLEISLRFLDCSSSDTADICTICYEQIKDISSLKVCGHSFCYECITKWMNEQDTCPKCRRKVSKKKEYIIRVKDQPSQDMDLEFENIRRSSGTKVANIVKYIKTKISEENLIVFSQYDDLLRDVGNILSEVGINVLYCRGSSKQKQSSIEIFSKSICNNVIMLSSTNSGSGCDLTSASHVIMLDVIDGQDDFVHAIEKQAISRCYRLGQTQRVNIIRFIIEDTIESTVYDKVYKNIDYYKCYELTPRTSTPL